MITLFDKLLLLFILLVFLVWGVLHSNKINSSSNDKGKERYFNFFGYIITVSKIKFDD